MNLHEAVVAYQEALNVIRAQFNCRFESFWDFTVWYWKIDEERMGRDTPLRPVLRYGLTPENLNHRMWHDPDEIHVGAGYTMILNPWEFYALFDNAKKVENTNDPA